MMKVKLDNKIIKVNKMMRHNKKIKKKLKKN